MSVSAYPRQVIVVNSGHSPDRMPDDVLHECFHLILNHRSARAIQSADGQLMISAYDKQQDAEADWLAAVLVLPRAALVAVATAGMEAGAVARH